MEFQFGFARVEVLGFAVPVRGKSLTCRLAPAYSGVSDPAATIETVNPK